MSQKIRAKFKCISVTHTEYGNSVKFEPVQSGSEENEKFFEMTPWGQFEMGTINPDIQFEPGEEFYLDFTNAK